MSTSDEHPPAIKRMLTWTRRLPTGDHAHQPGHGTLWPGRATSVYGSWEQATEKA